MLQPLIIELRRCPVRWWFPGFLGVDIFILLFRSRAWIGVWPQASAAAQLPTFYFGMALAAAAAWSAGRITRAEAEELMLQMPRSFWRREALALSAVWLYGLAAYILGVVVAAVLSFRSAGPGFLWPSYLLLGVSMITLCSGVGHLVGRNLRSSFMAPLVAVVVVFLITSQKYGEDHIFYVLTGSVQLGVSMWAVAVRLAVALAVALLAVTIVPWSERADARRTPRRYVPSVVAVVVLVTATIALGAGGSLRYRRPAPAPALCSSSAPRVCVWPENRKYLPVASGFAQRIASLPPGLMQMPDGFYEQGLRSGPGSDSDFNTVLDSWGIAQNMAFSVSAATARASNCSVSDANRQRYITATFEFNQWLTEWTFGARQPDDIHGGPPGIDESMIARLITLPRAEQTSWAQQRLQLMRSLCGSSLPS